MGPAFSRRHHVAVGIQGDGAALAIAAAHDQVGDGLQAIGLHFGLRHRVFLGFEAKALKQLGRTLGMGRVVTRRRIGRNADQLLQEAHFLIEVCVDPGVQFVVIRHDVSFARLARSSWNASTASCMSSLVLLSSGLWLMPELMPRTNSMAWGMTSCSFIASWPAPLGMR
jgi:hypothetical protein